MDLVLIDDHQTFRDALHAYLDRESDIRVVAETSSGIQGCALAEQHHPDVVLLDIALPDRDGVEAARLIRATPAPPKILMLSMHRDSEHVDRSMAAGATGYVCKDQPGSELVEAIRAVARGEAVAPSPLVHESGRAAQRIPELERLTTREKQVFHLLVAGDNNSAIASRLGISVKTVETHRARVLHKLHAHTLVDVVRFAARNDLL